MHILNQVQVNLIYNTNRNLFLWIEICICTTDLYNGTADRWSCHLPNRNACATQVIPMGVGRSVPVRGMAGNWTDGPSKIARCRAVKTSVHQHAHRQRSLTKRNTWLPLYRLTSREHFDMVVERENNNKSQQKKEKGKKCSGTESEQAGEYEPKIAKKKKKKC